MLDVERIRADFPALAQEINGRPLIYLDSAATAQKPRQVLAAMQAAYVEACGNVHRAVHTLSQRATERYEAARATVARFLNARAACEIVFVRGATEAINLLAATLGARTVGPGDEVLITGLEHHANLVPWQLLCEKQGARLRVLPFDRSGRVEPNQLDAHLTPRTRIFALCHAANSLGTILPVRALCERARAAGAVVVVDGAQAVPHLAVDVQELCCDFYCFSGHKLYGPTGIGVLWGRAEQLAALPPWQTGGEMVLSVTHERTLFREPPARFEAGTPPVAEAIGLAAAIDYLSGLGLDAVAAHEAAVAAHARRALVAVEGLTLHGPPRARRACRSFPFRCRLGGAPCTRTTSPRCSTAKASRCAPATTVRSRCTRRSEYPPRCVPRLRSTAPRPRSTRSLRPWAAW